MTTERSTESAGGGRAAAVPGAAPVTDDNGHFWKGGRDGELRFLRCQRLRLLDPPAVADLPDVPVEGPRRSKRCRAGRVHTFTVNHQPWYPGLDPPYVVAIVELDEQDGLRLTTNIVGCEPDDVSIGMPVQVMFEHYDDVWLPFFEPAPMSAADDRLELRRGHLRHRPVPDRPAHLPRPARAHARRLPRRDRRRRAHPRRHRRPRHLPRQRWTRRPASRGGGVTEVQDALRLNLNWFAGGLELPGQLGSVVNACMAVATGLANHVLCFRTVWEAPRRATRAGPR